jgi:transposase-like protein
MAIFAFVFIVGMIAVLSEYLEERRKLKEKKKCPRCKERRKHKKIIRIGQKYSYKLLCGDCKKKFQLDEEEGECEESSTIESSQSFIQITRNGKTITIINGKRVREE